MSASGGMVFSVCLHRYKIVIYVQVYHNVNVCFSFQGTMNKDRAYACEVCHMAFKRNSFTKPLSNTVASAMCAVVQQYVQH
jgi:hypothetical protein